MILRKRQAAFFVVLIGIFFLTGAVYVMAGKKIFGSEKPIEVRNIEIKKEVAADIVSEVPPKNENQAADETDKAVTDPTDISAAPSSVASPVLVQATSEYPLHKNITVTYFWAGEEADADNKNISNLPSAWDEDWVKHFGGVDDPNKRSGFFPAKFAPKENPFYFALPYNDFDSNGNRKKEVYSLVGWAKSVSWKDNQSILKNQWIKIMKGNNVAYAQWQDVGPFKEDDAAYVFGNALPKSKINNHAGLDVSPAVHDMLGLADVDKVDWQFVDADQVPDGPWKKVVTTSQIYWK